MILRVSKPYQNVPILWRSQTSQEIPGSNCQYLLHSIDVITCLSPTAVTAPRFSSSVLNHQGHTRQCRWLWWIFVFPQTVYCWGSQCCLKCVRLGWDAVSASLVSSSSCLRSCLPTCLPSWLGCCVRLPGLVFLLSPVLSPV